MSRQDWKPTAYRGKGVAKRADIMRFIRQYIKEHNYPPNMREIAAGVGLKNQSTVSAHLDTLEQEGYIRHDWGKSRGIVILKWSEAFDETVQQTAG